MEAVLACLLAAALAALAWLAARERACRHDLRALAELLDHADEVPAARARVSSGDPATRELAAAVDRRLEAEAVRDEARREADERFREQLAALSHDIRTPLAGAQGYLQLAERSSGEAERARYLAGAAGRLGAMRALVDDLFVYARSSDPSFSLELAACDLVAAVGEALAARHGELVARGWEPALELPEAASALAAPDALARVVANLLDNALRHGSGAPRVRVEGSVLTVENPVGAADAARLDPSRLTDRFYQGDPSRAGGGTGLGLAVARSLAEAMGGSLDVGVLLSPPTFSARLTLRPAP